MKTKKILVANWKNYIKTPLDITRILSGLKNGFSNIDFVICPPTIYIKYLVESINNDRIFVGSQNHSSTQCEASTGEILASMIKNIGCHYSLVGHSELRQKYNETNSAVSLKVKVALEFNLIPIICIGEKIGVRRKRQHIEFLIKQAIDSIPQVDMKNKTIIMAYEPIWSVGTDKTPSNSQIEEVIKALKKALGGIYNLQFIYGGSVNNKNIQTISQIDCLDGVLVGRDSLDINSLNEIANILQK